MLVEPRQVRGARGRGLDSVDDEDIIPFIKGWTWRVEHKVPEPYASSPLAVEVVRLGARADAQEVADQLSGNVESKGATEMRKQAETLLADLIDISASDTSSPGAETIAEGTVLEDLYEGLPDTPAFDQELPSIPTWGPGVSR